MSNCALDAAGSGWWGLTSFKSERTISVLSGALFEETKGVYGSLMRSRAGFLVGVTVGQVIPEWLAS